MSITDVKGLPPARLDCMFREKENHQKERRTCPREQEKLLGSQAEIESVCEREKREKQYSHGSKKKERRKDERLFFFFFFFFFFFWFLGPYLQHTEVPRLGVQSELQLPAYTTATATLDLNHVCHLHHSSWQHQILNPRSKARDRTHDLMVPSHVHFLCTTTGTPRMNDLEPTQGNGR